MIENQDCEKVDESNIISEASHPDILRCARQSLKYHPETFTEFSTINHEDKPLGPTILIEKPSETDT